jgi:50S ribosomal subunit-associated GTPase HflX
MFANEELNRIIKDESLKGVPVLMFYNKIDIVDKCKSKEELNSRL